MQKEPGRLVFVDETSVKTNMCRLRGRAARGAWFLFLPKYSPDLNPIEMAFAKLKAHLRRAAARSYDALWQAIGDICRLFQPHECWNFFKAQNYVAD